jgi:hypothetical protein
MTYSCASEWLLSVGPLVKRLNEESRGDASDEARAASLRPQPAARFSQSGIAIAEHLRDDGGDSNPLSRNS